MKKLLIVSLVFLGLVGLALRVPPSVDAAPEGQGSSVQTLTLDVAVDGRTYRLNRVHPDLPPPPQASEEPGDTFIIYGKIYPGGTIAPGGTMEQPGPFDPDSQPGIGTWVCRGHFLPNFPKDENGDVATTQLFLLKSRDGLVSEGLEGNLDMPKTVRAILGGMGEYSSARGEVTQEIIGTNVTGCSNSRFTFALKQSAPAKELERKNLRFLNESFGR